MRNSLPLTSTVPPSAIAQFALPGIDAVAAPVHRIAVPDNVAVAVPAPETVVVPLQVAEKVPDTLVAVACVMVQVKFPQLFGWVDWACGDARVPRPRPAVTRDVTVAAAGVGEAGLFSQPPAIPQNARRATVRRKHMAGSLALPEC